MEIQLFKALKAYDWSSVDLVLTTAESRLLENQSEIAVERQYHIDKLRNYLARNWDYIKPMAKRQLPLSKGNGVCETGHRYYSYRLKRQGRVWTEAGAANVAGILNAINNNEFIEGLTSEIDPVKLSLGDDIKGAVRSAFKNISTTSVGATYGRIVNNGPSSSPIKKLAKMFS